MYIPKSLIALGLTLCLLAACAAPGQAPVTSPEPTPEPESPSSISEPAPKPESAPEPKAEPEPSQPEEPVSSPDKNPDTSALDPNGPNPGLESYAAVMTQRVEPLRDALKAALVPIEEDYSEVQVTVEDESLAVVLEIGVIHEEQVDRFLANWTGPSWDKVDKHAGTWSVTEQEAFAAAATKLDLGSGVRVEANRELGLGESVLVTIRPDDTVEDPLSRWDAWRQAVKDFAKEQGAPEEMIEFMYVPPPKDMTGGNNPDT